MDVRTFPGPFLSLPICSLYRASSPSSFLIFTSMDAMRVSVWGGHPAALTRRPRAAVAESETTDRRDGVLQRRARLLAGRGAKDAVHGVAGSSGGGIDERWVAGGAAEQWWYAVRWEDVHISAYRRSGILNCDALVALQLWHALWFKAKAQQSMARAWAKLELRSL